ncbi:hypothetical protein [Metabacillus halosaccharovorans]|uniref:hypothetical protein n=1 Tax=Metabacillus halosaccharovorans TaxID=930124 RepID=UPI003735A408
MIKISSIKDFIKLEANIPLEFVQYIKKEFYNLFEYLSNGEEVEDFLLPFHLNMIVLEEKNELNSVLNNRMELEFIDEEYIMAYTILRLGVNREGDIQLYYWIKLSETE